MHGDIAISAPLAALRMIGGIRVYRMIGGIRVYLFQRVCSDCAYFRRSSDCCFKVNNTSVRLDQYTPFNNCLTTRPVGVSTGAFCNRWRLCPFAAEASNSVVNMALGRITDKRRMATAFANLFVCTGTVAPLSCHPLSAPPWQRQGLRPLNTQTSREVLSCDLLSENGLSQIGH